MTYLYICYITFLFYLGVHFLPLREFGLAFLIGLSLFFIGLSLRKEVYLLKIENESNN